MGEPAVSASTDDPLLRVNDLVVEYQTRGRRRVRAVSGVSFDVARGETLGLVGESGCGKSSTGKAIMQLPRPTAGTVTFAGHVLTQLDGAALRRQRSGLQMIFQDPLSSLNPWRSVRDIVSEPLRIWGSARGERAERVREMLDAVGIDPSSSLDRRPHEFSGGQCQRISIARALILEPQLVVCDEPVSALDVSVQSQILNLLQDMKDRFGLTLIFISHDLAVIRNVADRVAVMYLGKLCEVGPADVVLRTPAHHYTSLLLSAVPNRGGRKSVRSVQVADADVPSPFDPPSGCRFRTRCPVAAPVCAEVEPPLRELSPGHLVSCHMPTAHRSDAASVVGGGTGHSVTGR